MISDSGRIRDWDDRIILDVGQLRQPIEYYLQRVLPATEISLKEAWDLLGLGKTMVFRFGMKGCKKTQRSVTYDKALDLIDEYDDVFWCPQFFHDPKHATIASLKSYRTLTIDVDDKLDPLFWSKTRDIFAKWGLGEMVSGLPAPTMYTLSGGGYHPYWRFKLEYVDDRMKDWLKLLLCIVRYKISTYYQKCVDKIHLVHIFRIPESKTKYGTIARSFTINNGFNGTIDDFMKSVLTEDEFKLVKSYLAGDIEIDVLRKAFEPYASAVGQTFISNEKPKELPIDLSSCDVINNKDLYDNIDGFNPGSIGIFSKLIDDEESIVNKDFAKRGIFIIKILSPVKEGSRNNKLLALAVTLAKCGASIESIIKILHLVNDTFFEEPLMDREVYNCYCWYYKELENYKRIRSLVLKEWYGIKYWPVFVKRESTMTRSEAARLASKHSHEIAVDKLKQAYAEIGFNAKIKDICNLANISRQTFNRYKKNGVLKELFNWFINVSGYAQTRKYEIVKLLRKLRLKFDFVDNNDISKIDQYSLALTSRKLAYNL